MIDIIFSYMACIIGACFSWFDSILSAMGNAQRYIIVALFVVLGVRFLLMPFVSGNPINLGKSDSSSKDLSKLQNADTATARLEEGKG